MDQRYVIEPIGNHACFGMLLLFSHLWMKYILISLSYSSVSNQYSSKTIWMWCMDKSNDLCECNSLRWTFKTSSIYELASWIKYISTIKAEWQQNDNRMTAVNQIQCQNQCSAEGHKSQNHSRSSSCWVFLTIWELQVIKSCLYWSLLVDANMNTGFENSLTAITTKIFAPKSGFNSRLIRKTQSFHNT
jgi:hypothetical protein